MQRRCLRPSCDSRRPCSPARIAIATVALAGLIQAGCGPVYRVSPLPGERRHEAVRWVYRTQSRPQVWGGPGMLYGLGVLLYNNAVVGVAPLGERVAIYERPFSKRPVRIQPDAVVLDLETGTPNEGVSAPRWTGSENTGALVTPVDRSGWRIEWDNEARFRIRVRSPGEAHAIEVMSAPRNAEPTTLLPLCNDTLIIVLRRRSGPAYWNHAYDVMCVDGNLLKGNRDEPSPVPD